MTVQQDREPGCACPGHGAPATQASTLRQRLREQWAVWRTLADVRWSIPAAVLVFVGLFVLHSLVIDKYFSNESAIVARGTAVMGSNAYSSTASDDIVVLELNDPYLALMGETWPPSYALYQAIFEDAGRYQPKSLFFDIALVHSRTQDGVQALYDSMCRLHQQGTKVYLAALENAQGQLYVRPELEALAQTTPCFTKVGVRYDADPHTHLASTYPLLGNGARLWLHKDKTADLPALCARQTIVSAAYQIASDAKGVDLTGQHADTGIPCPAPQRGTAAALDTMSLTWAMRSHAWDPSRPMWIGCNAAPSRWAELIPTPLRNMAVPAPLPCPFHRHVPLTSLAVPDEGQEERLMQALRGKHLMVGAAVQGIQDSVNSPIQGYIPGVYLHAMALDNLLTQWPHIKSVETSGTQMLVVWLLAGVLGAVCYVIYGLLQAALGLQHVPSAPQGARVGERLRHEVGHASRWMVAKLLEVGISLGLSWLVFQLLLNHSSHSVQALAQLLAVVFALQWTGLTDKVFRSMLYIATSHPK